MELKCFAFSKYKSIQNFKLKFFYPNLYILKLNLKLATSKIIQDT